VMQDPRQQSRASPEPLTNVRIAKYPSCPAVALLPVLDVSLPLNAHPPIATAATNAPAAIHFQDNARWGAGAAASAAADIATEAATGRFPRHASRSARISCAL